MWSEQRWNSILQGACALLLIAAIWGIHTLGDKLEVGVGNGQSFTGDGVTTERWIGEDLEAWSKRHLSAVEEFEEKAEGNKVRDND